MGREKGQKSNFFQNHFVAGFNLWCILPFLPDCRSVNALIKLMFETRPAKL